MFDVSFTELIVIGVVALIVLGPERLPKVARTVGHLLGRAQRYVNDVKSDIQREIELDELRQFKQKMDSAAQEVNQSLQQAGDSMRDAGQALRGDLDAAARSINEAAAEAKRTIAPPPDAPSAQALPPAATDSATPAAPTEATTPTTPAPPSATPAASADPVPERPANATPATDSKTPANGNAGNAT